MDDVWKRIGCKNCIFKVGNRCRESPPTPITHGYGSYARHPEVTDEEFACSKYQVKEKKGEKENEP